MNKIKHKRFITIEISPERIEKYNLLSELEQQQVVVDFLCGIEDDLDKMLSGLILAQLKITNLPRIMRTD